MAEQGTELTEDKSFWDHLDDLRKTLFKMAITIAVFMTVFFIYMPWLFDHVILAPCNGDFVLYRIFAGITDHLPGFEKFSTEGFHVDLINLKLASQFFTHISTSFWMALVFAFPVLLYQLWSFVRPALYDNEVRGARIAFSLGTGMFYLGVLVGYFVVFPITLRFLFTYELSAAIHNLAWTMSAIGILRRPFFKRYRRHAIVVLLILAAVITPTGDPFTLAIVFLPIYLLYEMSALLVKKE